MTRSGQLKDSTTGAVRFDAEIRGVRYAGIDTGGDGDPVLLLHGWPDDRSMWRRQIDDLYTNGYRVVAIDWIGHGGSGKPTSIERYAIDELVADLAALVRERGLGRAHLVAHDYGAVIGWVFAAAHPDLVRTYSAIAIGHPGAVLRAISPRALVNNWFLAFNALPVAVPLYRAFGAAFFKWAMRAHPDRDKVVAKFRNDPHPLYIRIWELANPMGALIGRFLLRSPARIGKLPMPVQGLYGVRDHYATPRAMSLSRRFVDGPWRFVPVNDAGHWSPLERPDEINSLLRSWFALHAQREEQANDVP